MALPFYMDPQNIGPCVFKLFQFSTMVGSIFFTEKLFSNMYMQTVYANNQDPPNLFKMLGIFLGINLAFTMLTFAFLFLLAQVLDRVPSLQLFATNFIAENMFRFAFDYVIYMVLLVSVLSVVIAFMQKKRYFRYKTEGLRAIRAFKGLSIGIAGILLAVPYFVVLPESNAQ